MILITAYDGPDLDGSACAFAYAELLNKKGEQVEAGIFNDLRLEARFAFDLVKAKIANGSEIYKRADNVVLVDACEIKGISKEIDSQKVIEVIDHRPVNQAREEFPNATIQVELVGSCATLITEKFIKNEIKPSKESATLLYLAIASNTINFKNNVTTDRDIEAAKYLKSLYPIDDKLVLEMFAHQSNLVGTIREIFERDKWSNFVAGQTFSIFQFEIIGVDEYIRKNYLEIVQSLKDVMAEEKFDFTFATFVDLEKARNTFVVPDEKVGNLIGEIIGLKFENNIAHYPKIIMRKEIMPKIKNYFELHK